MFVHNCLYILVSEHFSFAKRIHPPDRCGISRTRLNSIVMLECWSVGLVTERLQVQIPKLTRYKSVVLLLNRQLTHCS